MHRFWSPAIRPLLEALDPASVIEVGADRGYQTRLLAQWCRESDSTLHVIDPLPKFEEEPWFEESRSVLQMHRTLSLTALPVIGHAEAVLIDGDHNWYTVSNELRLIARHAASAGRPFPLVALHDVGWPYGRRDLYYDPDTVPVEHRHPYEQSGLHPSTTTLVPVGGLNSHLHNAVEEGGPRNGVLTAVEDFLAGCTESIATVQIAGFHGLLVAVDRDVIADNPDVARIFRELGASAPIGSIMQSLERARVEAVMDSVERQGTSREVAEALGREKEDHAQTKEQLAGAVTRLSSLRDEQVRLQDAVSASKARYERLRSRRSVRAALRVAEATKPLRRGATRTVPAIQSPRRGPGAGSGERPRRRVAVSRPPAASARNPVPVAGRRSAGRACDVVICVHDALEEVRQCIESVVGSTNLTEHHVVLVDDGSGTETAEFLRATAAERQWTLVRHDEARGYGVAADAGTRAGSGDFVVLLNSDTVVFPGWLERLVAVATEDARVAVVGPLSNAASWQSVPDVTGLDGTWATNTLRDDHSRQDVAQTLAHGSPRLYPAVELVNGFCYLVRRSALDEVGGIDVERFARGYGEEDDLSLRLGAAGYTLRIADDCYVYHHKSRSFTAEGRQRTVAGSKKALLGKHGGAVATAVASIQRNEELVRARTYASLLISGTGRPVETDVPVAARPTVLWIQPHLAEVGGIRRTIEMTNRLGRLGFRVTLATPDGTPSNWLTIRSEVRRLSDLQGRSFDLVLASDPDVFHDFLQAKGTRRVLYHLAAYMDYREDGAALREFYGRQADVTHVANSAWTAERIRSHAGIDVAGIFPGAVDKKQFHPVRVPTTHDVVCYGSPRVHKGTADIVAATRGHSLLRLHGQGAKQHELPRLICSARVFASACWHEGFNFSPLEAMACGVPVAMTDDGGSREYARNGENAVVVPPRDVSGLEEAVDRLLGDAELRGRIVRAGLVTAWAYDWDKATRDLAEFLCGIA